MPYGRRDEMRILGALCTALVLFLFPSVASAQELTTAQVLQKLDEKAKSFTTLEALIVKDEMTYGAKQPLESGKIYLKATKNGPWALLELAPDKRKGTKALIKDGTALAYFVDSNNYQRTKADPNSTVLQIVTLGFGVPSSTYSKVYSPGVKGRETIDGVRTVVLELSKLP